MVIKHDSLESREKAAPPYHDLLHPGRNVLAQLAESLSGGDCISIGLNIYCSIGKSNQRMFKPGDWVPL